MAGRSLKDLLKGSGSSEWVTLSVNLRRSQYELLSRIADELGMTPSRATRRILAVFLDESGDAQEKEEQRK